MILINGNSKKHWLSQCLHINIQVLLEGELTLDSLTIMSEILINYLKSLTMGHLLWQHSKVSSCEEVLGGCLYCLFYWSSIQRLWIFLVLRTDVTLSLQRNTYDVAIKAGIPSNNVNIIKVIWPNK